LIIPTAVCPSKINNNQLLEFSSITVTVASRPIRTVLTAGSFIISLLLWLLVLRRFTSVSSASCSVRVNSSLILEGKPRKSLNAEAVKNEKQDRRTLCKDAIVSKNAVIKCNWYKTAASFLSFKALGEHHVY